jgi:hypothetical protein
MSLEKRTELIDSLVEERPELRKPITNQASSMLTGNWDLVAYSYQQSFEALWDHAFQQTSGLAQLPLMMLCRQSVELTIKAAIQATTLAQPPNGHGLTILFDRLLAAREEAGCFEQGDDEYTQEIRQAVINLQEIDARADRFRYPTDLNGKAYPGFNVDLEQLLQIHWLITTWCDCASTEAEQYYLHVRS